MNPEPQLLNPKPSKLMNPSTAAHLHKVHDAMATDRRVRAPTEALGHQDPYIPNGFLGFGIKANNGPQGCSPYSPAVWGL